MTGTYRERTSASSHGRGRRGLPQAHRSEEGQEVGLLALTDRRVHQSTDGHGQAAQEGNAKEAEGDQEETETGIVENRIPDSFEYLTIDCPIFKCLEHLNI